MSNRSIAAIATLLLALGACATRPRPAASAAQGAVAADGKPLPPAKIVCVNEAPVGSHITKRVCRPVDDADRERRAAQLEMLRARSGPQPKTNLGGP